MATAHAPIIEHLPEAGVTVISRWLFNCYVIHDGGAGVPVVVDLGLPSQVPVVDAQLTAHGSSIAAIGAAVATHGHADHVGGLPGLREAASPAIYLPSAIRDMRDGVLPIRMPGPKEVQNILPVMADQPRDFAAAGEVREIGKVIGCQKDGVNLPFEPDAWLDDGSAIAALPDWQVLHTPGHSDDSTCLYHPETQTMLSGDTILSVGRRAWFNPEFVDGGRSAATEERLRALPVRTLLPGHGRTVTGTDVLGAALGHRDQPEGLSKPKALLRVLTNHAARHPE